MVNIEKEYAKCVMDSSYTIENYFKVWNNVIGDYIPFKLLKNQKRVLDGYDNYKLNIVKKYRQAGISSLNEAYLTYKGVFCEPEKPEVVMIVANKLQLSQNALSKIRKYLLGLPRWVWGSEYYGSEENETKDILITNNKNR